MCIFGLTLDELADVARVDATRKVTSPAGSQRRTVSGASRRSNDRGRRYIVNFSRRPLFGAGVGHYSPIGGYLEAEELVFVLDVNQDYRPWLVERTRLFEAVNTFDGDKKRGLLLIE